MPDNGVKYEQQIELSVLNSNTAPDTGNLKPNRFDVTNNKVYRGGICRASTQDSDTDYSVLSTAVKGNPCYGNNLLTAPVLLLNIKDVSEVVGNSFYDVFAQPIQVNNITFTVQDETTACQKVLIKDNNIFGGLNGTGGTQQQTMAYVAHGLDVVIDSYTYFPNDDDTMLFWGRVECPVGNVKSGRHVSSRGHYSENIVSTNTFGSTDQLPSEEFTTAQIDLAYDHIGKELVFKGLAPQTFTLKLSTHNDINIGSEIKCINFSDQVLTLEADAGVYLNGVLADSITPAKYTTTTLKKIGANDWIYT
jgi:hypothetical protein